MTPDRPRTSARDIVLVLITALGTLAILFGVVALLSGREAPPGQGDSATGIVESVPARSSGPIDPGGSESPAGVTPGVSPSAGASGDPVLVGAGDIARCDRSGDEATAALLDGIAGTVFTAGDNAYESGTAPEFTTCFGPSWGRHLARIRPAPGNHDHETDRLAGYLGYFGATAGSVEQSWYTYDLGTWHVVVLDSTCRRVTGGCGPDSPQVRWLRENLARNDSRCTLAIWHHPRFSSGEHGNDPDVAAFWDELYAAGADLVINGHDHDYERFAPQAPDGRADPERGLRQFVVGTGGAELRGFPDVVANSELRVSISHGVIALTLHPAGYDWVFVPTEGSFEDRGTAPCH